MGSDEIFGMEMDDEILQELEEDILIVYIMMIVAYNTHKLFNPNELEDGGQNTINPQCGSYGRSQSDARHANIVQGLDYCKVYGFDELASLVCPTILDNAPSTNIERVKGSKPMKLTPKQRLFNFTMYLKHDNVLSYECF